MVGGLDAHASFDPYTTISLANRSGAGMPNSKKKARVASAYGSLDAISAKIMGMERKHQWNGPGSRAIRKTACVAAIKVVLATRRSCEGFPLPRVGPSQLGGVSLQWKFGDV